MAEKQTHEEINQKKILPKASSAQWQTTFDAINDAVCLLDMNGKILRCNKAMEGLLKKSSEEIIGSTCWELVHGTDKPIKGCPIVRMKKTLRRETIVLEVDDKWLNIAVDPVIDETGNITSAVHIISDITRGKQAEQSLREAEAELKHIIEVVPDIIAKVNAHTGYFTYCNPALSSILGFSSEEFLTRPFIEFIHPDDRQSTINEVEKQLKGSPLARFENRYICKNGSYKWLEWRATAADEKEVIYAAATDITERKRMEEELRLHAAMMDNVAEGVYLIGLDDLLIKWTNEKFARMFGYGSGEMVGKHVDIVNAPTEKTPTETRISIVDVLKETGEWHGEVRNIKRDGTHFWCSANVSLFDHPEYGKVMVSVHADITEHKKAEELLRKSELRYRSLTDNVLDTSSVGIFILDSDFHVVWVNQALERCFGLRREEIIGKDKRQLIRERIKDIFENPVNFAEKVFATYDDNTYIEHFECHIVPGSEREERWLEHWSQPILSGPYAGGRVEHYSDITERKKAERKLQERMNELETFYRATLGREERVVELKQEVNELLKQLGKNKKYRNYS